MLKYIIVNLFFVIIIACASATAAPRVTPNSVPPQSVQTTKGNDAAGTKVDTIQGTQNNTPEQNNLQIDTAGNVTTPQQTVVPIDTSKKLDSSLVEPVSENVLTNTKLFIYIILSVLGLALFFYIFVISLFKTFHKKKSTRQSLLLSWNLFFIVTIVWIFIIWGLVAGFWSSASFMIVVIFLFIISLIMTIIAVKSK
ncbi:MAG: hypothetical protein SGI89_13765 [bacterium]|nr:hypothetical protein [bacterium]